MTILALEFSSDRRSVAIARDGKVLSESVQQTEARATNAFGLIEQALAEAKISRGEIDAIAVGLGPGSYTGIRAAISIAHGWQLARGVKLLSVSSAEAIAAQAQSQNNFGRVNVVIDAQRGEFYLATWEISDSHRQEIEPLKIVPAIEIDERQQAGEIFVGPAREKQIFPRSTWVASLSFFQGSNGELEPIYLRGTNFAKASTHRLM